MARLIPIRSGGLGSFSEAKAFAWAADHGADIISCSWGPPDGIWYDPNDPAHRIPFPLPDSSRLAIDYALKKGRNGYGSLLVWAAGNGNEEIQYDGYASLPTILAVAACDFKEKRSPYSDFGQNIACCFPSSSASSTPSGASDGIWTTDRSHALGYNPEGDYVGTFGGTSASCPGVAGCLALILSLFPKLKNRHIRPILNMTSDKISADTGKYTNGHSHYFGYGRINPHLAILFIKQILVIETEIKWNNNSQIEGIRCVFQQNIFHLNLSYYLINTKKQCLSGQWLLFEENAFSVDQIVFELNGLDAPLFILKRYDREDGQFVKLKLIWK
jgi:subtilisin family serine protease